MGDAEREAGDGTPPELLAEWGHPVNCPLKCGMAFVGVDAWLRWKIHLIECEAAYRAARSKGGNDVPSMARK